MQTEPERDVNDGPPSQKFVEYVTLKEIPGRNEQSDIHMYIERSMAARPYIVHSESDFDYWYENAPNRIRELRRGYVSEIDYRDKFGKNCRKAFVVRFLPSPLYEIEKQKEYDDAMMRRAEKMKAEEVRSGIERKRTEEKVLKRELSDDEAIKSFQKAKMMAEQNASIPPVVETGLPMEFSPTVIPLSEDDKVKEDLAKKEAKDSKKKEQEMQMLNAFLRNKEKIKGVRKQ